MKAYKGYLWAHCQDRLCKPDEPRLCKLVRVNGTNAYGDREQRFMLICQGCLKYMRGNYRVMSIVQKEAAS